MTFISVKTHLYILIVLFVFIITGSTLAIAYTIINNQIDKYYGDAAKDNAVNVASFLDGDFIEELRKSTESDEFQTIRDKAEKEGNEELIKDYLKSHNLWDKFEMTRRNITNYQNNMSQVKYVYIIAHGKPNDTKDMYLIDEEEVPLYQTGYYEDREKEFGNQDLANLSESVINYSDYYGWLCSNYAPIYNSKNECVAIAGCDLDLYSVVYNRKWITILIGIWTFVLTLIIIAISIYIANKVYINPILEISDAIKKFTPGKNMHGNIINMDMKHNNEIYDIAKNIKLLEMDVIEYINSIKIKNRQIEQLDILSTRDALTEVGNVFAYKNKIEELNIEMQHRINYKFAILMADINNLKTINDTYGHKEGDEYIIKCCKILCDTLKHSAIFRIGGDEFVAILQNNDYQNREELYDKLTKTFEKNLSNTKLPVNKRYSMSLGLAEILDTDVTTDTIFKRADKIMYHNKEKIKKQIEEKGE